MYHLRVITICVILLFTVPGISQNSTEPVSISLGYDPDTGHTASDLLIPEFTQIWNFSHNSYIGKAAPAVGDLDGDGQLEVVINTGLDVEKVFALDALNGTVKWQATAAKGHGAPVLGDFNGDDLLDVVVPDDNSIKAYCGLNGSLIWNYPIEGVFSFYSRSPSLADIDGDSKLEVIFGGEDGRLHVLRNNGSLLWQFDRQDTDTYAGAVAIGDVDGDGALEIIHSQSWGDFVAHGGCYVLNAEDGSVLWSKSYDGVAVTAAPVIGDVNQDGSIDVLVPIGLIDTGEVILYNGLDGSVIWRYDCSCRPQTVPAIGDINNDGKLEVVFGFSEAIVALNGADGTELWEVPHEAVVESSPALADLNGDDILDVIIGGGYDFRNLYVLDGATGDQIWTFTTPPIDHPTLRETMNASPTLWDIDGDGDIELIVQANGYTYVFNITGGGNRIFWQGYGSTNDFTGTRCLSDIDPDSDTISSLTESILGTDSDDSDSDGDSLLDNEELYLFGTSPLRRDTDQDNMPDDWEIEYGLNPLLDDSFNDPDSDGYTNLAEFQNGTDPFSADPNPTPALQLAGLGIGCVVLIVGAVFLRKRQ